MSYSLFWRSPALPFVQKQTAISVPAGAVVSNAASIRFTGKGATNYGKIAQENLMRLLENFAGATEPNNPTVGQTWYDTSTSTLKVCVATPPVSVSLTGDWEQLNTTQITPPGFPPPLNPQLGDTWFSQTGTASGVLYVYTGVGRYPAKNWDGVTAGYFPPVSTTAVITLNSSDGVNSDFSEAFIHNGALAAGTILVNSVTTLLPLGFVGTNHPVIDGLIVWDQTATMVSGFGTPSYFCVQKTNDGRWFYDNNRDLVEFTPVAGMYVVGRMTVGGAEGSIAPGVTSGTMFNFAEALWDFIQTPATLTNGAIGGWEQIWPTVETHGGRAEYEYVYGQLAALIGNPMAFSGSGAEGRSVSYLTDFRALDASMLDAWKDLIPHDTNVLNTNFFGDMKVDPNSQDWDRLLTACRYAVDRLELPSGFSSDIATHPFVQDGLPPPAGLTVPTERKVRTRMGTISMMSQYQETVNVLRAAVQNRYTIKGLLEQSGIGNTYSPTVSFTNQATFNASSSLVGITHGLRYRFDYEQHDVRRFFFSGGTIELVLTYNASTNPADVELTTLVSNKGRIRITADNTYPMTVAPSPNAALGQAPSNLGFLNMTVPGIVLATLTQGGTTVVIRGAIAQTPGITTPNLVLISVDFIPSGATTGVMTATWNYIRDTELYGLLPVYPAPLGLVGADKLGSGIFV